MIGKKDTKWSFSVFEEVDKDWDIAALTELWVTRRVNPEMEPEKLGGNGGVCSIRKTPLDNGPYYYNLYEDDQYNVALSRVAYHEDLPIEERYKYERSSASPVQGGM